MGEVSPIPSLYFGQGQFSVTVSDFVLELKMPGDGALGEHALPETSHRGTTRNRSAIYLLLELPDDKFSFDIN